VTIPASGTYFLQFTTALTELTGLLSFQFEINGTPTGPTATVSNNSALTTVCLNFVTTLTIGDTVQINASFIGESATISNSTLTITSLPTPP